jgi:hypothetical protein
MKTKEEIVNEIVSQPLSYALFRECLKDGKWDREKLEFMDIVELNYYLRDIKTFERNKIMLNGKGNH